MRKLLVALVVVLLISITLNVLLFVRTRALDRAYQQIETFLGHYGHFQGAEDARQDFAEGRPKWYMIGDFGGSVPADKPGRTPAKFGCIVTPYEHAYVQSYNDTMDELFEKRRNDPEAQ